MEFRMRGWTSVNGWIPPFTMITFVCIVTWADTWLIETWWTRIGTQFGWNGSRNWMRCAWSRTHRKWTMRRACSWTWNCTGYAGTAGWMVCTVKSVGKNIIEQKHEEQQYLRKYEVKFLWHNIKLRTVRNNLIKKIQHVCIYNFFTKQWNKSK